MFLSLVEQMDSLVVKYKKSSLPGFNGAPRFGVFFFRIGDLLRRKWRTHASVGRLLDWPGRHPPTHMRTHMFAWRRLCACEWHSSGSSSCREPTISRTSVGVRRICCKELEGASDRTRIEDAYVGCVWSLKRRSPCSPPLICVSSPHLHTLPGSMSVAAKARKPVWSLSFYQSKLSESRFTRTSRTAKERTRMRCSDAADGDWPARGSVRDALSTGSEPLAINIARLLSIAQSEAREHKVASF